MKVDSAIALVERSGRGIVRFHVHTNPTGPLLREPSCELTQQLTRNPEPAPRRIHEEILQLTIALVSAGQMASDVSDHVVSDERDVCDSCFKSLSGVMLSLEIGRHPWVGRCGSRIGETAPGHLRDIGDRRSSVMNVQTRHCAE